MQDYLDSENLTKTHGIFLEECKYLEEAKSYIKKGYSVPKTIHGKTLEEYLVINRKELGIYWLSRCSWIIIGLNYLTISYNIFTRIYMEISDKDILSKYISYIISITLFVNWFSITIQTYLKVYQINLKLNKSRIFWIKILFNKFLRLKIKIFYQLSLVFLSFLKFYRDVSFQIHEIIQWKTWRQLAVDYFFQLLI